MNHAIDSFVINIILWINACEVKQSLVDSCATLWYDSVKEAIET